MAKKKMCKVCGEKEATVPDRNYGGIGRRINEVCGDCHAARLRGDMRHILDATRRRREAAERIGK